MENIPANSCVLLKLIAPPIPTKGHSRSLFVLVYPNKGAVAVTEVFGRGNPAVLDFLVPRPAMKADQLRLLENSFHFPAVDIHISAGEYRIWLKEEPKLKKQYRIVANVYVDGVEY